MYIKELELYNFRQYKGNNTINLETEEDKNILIVSGMNGFGKTNFLIALVWCLYGSDTEKVDEFFKKIVDEQGGYKRYIANSLNWSAKNEGESRFYVSVTFSDIEITAVPCQTITVIRSYDINSAEPLRLDILFDNQINELVQQEYGYELFIRDFLIPLETAKFFFFDAEKIISLADSTIKSVEERKALSKAYSEVLGIQKYEDLRESLEEIQRRFTKESATPTEQKRLVELEKLMEQNEIDLRAKELEIDDLKEKNQSLRFESNQYQNKLIKEGNKITLDELESLRRRNEDIEQENFKVLNELKDFLDLAPFAIAGESMLEISEQIEKEFSSKKIKYQDEEIENKTEEILSEIEERKRDLTEIVKPRISEFYNNTIRQLIRKHFFDILDNSSYNIQHLHDFLETERNEFNAILNNLKHSYKQRFKSTTKEYNILRSERNNIGKRLRNAESNEEDPIVSDYRRKKAETDSIIIVNENRIEYLNQEIGGIKNQQNSIKAEMSELTKKVQIATQLKQKHELTKRILGELKEFIIRFKEEKRKRFAEKIYNSLSALMHKKLIGSVEVEMIGEDIEINLKRPDNTILPKDSLSNGEKQLYATALLRALSEESGVEFPVFVDSPMQKLDPLHSEQIILSFYPNVSKQVVIFPISTKELIQEEFEKLRVFVNKTFFIDHRDGISRFEEVPVELLFSEFKTRKNHWKSS
ncbi:AAA family ATPase [Haliscomenobacter hydrossis]|uniref:SMC domain protein n=1 Tax=Haliscomenobacter hydrossis (strain ATCC 27775 / DSM 1100 / LMG 10767 / O) TaxID=760192 RepID=F4L4C5_HALH1|nr:SMC domain-containing protein [Haliscomenobacter hydrossis]AEE51794.1 SMC domain protein [Haliscomenobacter hydrossis DSM 1100]